MSQDNQEQQETVRPSDVPDQQKKEVFGERLRLWIAIALAVLCLGLYAALKYFEVVEPNLETIRERSGITALQRIEEETEETIRGFGIEKSWISKKEFALPAYGKIRSKWKVYTPFDVPVASLNQEITTIAEEHNAFAIADEDLKTGIVSVFIKQDKRVVFSLEFIPDASKQRNGGIIVLLCDGLEEASDDEIEMLSKSKEPIACVIEPDFDVYELYNALKTEKKELVFHFHIHSKKQSEGKFEFYEDMPKAAIKRRLRFLLQTYPDAKAFYITTELLPGSAAEVMAAELHAHGLRQIQIDDMVHLDGSLPEEQLSARMTDLAAVSAKRTYVVGVILLKNGLTEFLTSEMIRLRKKGFDFITVAHAFRIEKRLVAQTKGNAR